MNGADAGPDHERPFGITGRWVNLRPPVPSDTEHFFRWRADATTLHLLHGNRRMPPLDEYKAELDQLLRSTNTLVVEDMGTREPAGYVQGYNANMADGWVIFLQYLAGAYHSRPHGPEATLLFLNYLFGESPFRKVYAEVFQYNDRVCRMLERGGFREEGRAREHTFYQDRFWDLINLALWREDWYRLRSRFHFLLKVESEATDLLLDKSGAGRAKEVAR